MFSPGLVCCLEEEGKEEEEGEEEEVRWGVPSGQTTPDGPSVLPTDRFPPTLTGKDRFLPTRDSPRCTSHIFEPPMLSRSNPLTDFYHQDYISIG